MKLDEIVNKYDVDYTKNLIVESQIGEIESALEAVSYTHLRSPRD